MASGGGGGGGYHNLTNLELRKRLLEVGVDMPVSVKKDFMIKILNQKEMERRRGRGGRGSLPPLRTTNGNNYEVASGSGLGLGRSSVPPQMSREIPQQPVSRRYLAQVPPPMEMEEEEVEDEEESEEEEMEDEQVPSNESSQQNASLELEQEEEEEEGQEHTPSPRFEQYLNFFRSGSRNDPFIMSPPRTRYSTPAGSPYSNRAVVGSPSFQRNNYRFDFDDSADESDLEVHHQRQRIREEGKGGIWSRIKPTNWIPKSFFTKKQETDNRNEQERMNFNFGSAGPSSRLSGPGPTSPTPNGHSSTRSAIANQIYSPVQPPQPAIPPPGTAGRNAGFKAFFTRGERNGLGYASSSSSNSDSSHWISRLIVLAVVILFLAIGAAYFYKTNSPSYQSLPSPEEELATYFEQEKGSKAKPMKPSAITLIRPICGASGYEDSPCIPHNVIHDAEHLFTAMKNELSRRSSEKCSSGLQDKLTLQKAKQLGYSLVQMARDEYERAFEGMLMLATENPASKVKVQFNGNDISIKNVPTVDLDTAEIFVVGVPESFSCWIIGWMYLVGKVGILCFIGSGIVYTGWKFRQFSKKRRAREDNEIYDLVEKVVEILHEHYEDSRTSGQEAFIAVKHIRDQLFSARERKQKEALWNKVVDEIVNNESRIRQEHQEIGGDQFLVWRWLPSASPVSKRMSSAPSSPVGAGNASSASSSSSPGLYPNLDSLRNDLDNDITASSSSNSKWQGQAFEMFDGSPNSLAQPPTTCLKIRQMFDNARDTNELRIQQAILDKCKNANILHIGIDRNSREGCVYIRCMTKNDAKIAHAALHGWWFEGHLLSVKFLREERYFQRFPDSRSRTHPLSLSNLPSASQSVIGSSPLGGRPSPFPAVQRARHTINF